MKINNELKYEQYLTYSFKLEMYYDYSIELFNSFIY